jgi:hypothetical protein
MRNMQLLNRVAPCLAILTIGAAFALPTASYAETSTVSCRPTPPNSGPDMPAKANGLCPRNYTQVQAENPGAIGAPGAGMAGGTGTGPGGAGGTGPGGVSGSGASGAK